MRLHDLDGVTGQPNLKLLEARFEAFLDFSEKDLSFRGVFRIHENSHQVVAEGVAFAAPPPLNDLRFTTDRAEAVLQFLHGLGQQRLRDAPAIIEP